MFKENKKIYNIVYFLDYGKFFGGAAHTLLQQAVLMKKMGHCINIFVSTYLSQYMDKEYFEICSKYDIQIAYEEYQLSSEPEDIDIICLHENYERLRGIIQKLEPDIIHSVQINPLAELIARELNIPHIMNVYPLLPQFFSVKYLDIFPHYHICDSWYWARKWNQYLKTDYTCIRTVVSTHTNSSQSILINQKVKYISVGVLCLGKNQLEIIKAFHSALKQGILGELSIYGFDAGEYAEKCKRYIYENNLENDIFVRGFCSNMGIVYRESDVLICGSVRESYPNAISEAMAYGLVVLSTPVGGVPELVEDGVNGYLTNGFTSEEICKKILEFHSDLGKERLKKIRINSYKTYELNHSPSIVTENLLTYYDHVIDDNKKSSEIDIFDIRRIFNSYIDVFYKSFNFFTDSKKVSTKLWYLFYIKKNIELEMIAGSRFYIWGTGTYGTAVKEIVEIFLPDIHISGFLDSKKEGSFDNYIICKPDDILSRENVVIFVGVVNGQNEVIEKLELFGKQFNKDYYILSARAW